MPPLFGDLRVAHFGWRIMPKGRVIRAEAGEKSREGSAKFIFIQVLRALKKCLLQTQIPRIVSFELGNVLFVS